MNKINMHYQPIYNHSKLIGYEALVRGTLARRCIDLFTKSNINCKNRITHIDEHLKRLAIREFNINSTKLFINSHPFSDNLYPKSVVKTSLDPENIVIEITEHAPLSDKIMCQINDVKNKGHMIAVDDYKPNSIFEKSFIEKISPEYVKIDRSVITDVFNSDSKSKESSTQFLYDTLELCSKTSSKIIIEGIETQEHFNYCIENNLLSQGYFLGRPMPLY